MRTIDADALAEHKFVSIDCYLKSNVDNGYSRYKQGWNDAIDAIIDNAPTVCNDNYSMGYQDGVKTVLSERGHGEWILIGERLPDRFEAVLVTFQIPNREPIVYRAVYVNGKFDLDNGDTWNWNDPEIKAWMPLPEAYKETDNEADN